MCIATVLLRFQSHSCLLNSGLSRSPMSSLLYVQDGEQQTRSEQHERSRGQYHTLSRQVARLRCQSQCRRMIFGSASWGSRADVLLSLRLRVKALEMYHASKMRHTNLSLSVLQQVSDFPIFIQEGNQAHQGGPSFHQATSCHNGLRSCYLTFHLLFAF